MTDTLDTFLSQATVVAYAVPEVGAALAAEISIVQAVRDALKPDTPAPEYTVAQAIADLGQKIAEDLESQNLEGQLATIHGWELAVKDTGEDIANFATTGEAADAEVLVDAFIADHDFNKEFGAFASTQPRSEERVKSLGTYFMARTTYHSLCVAKLQYLARARGRKPDEWTAVHSPVRTRLEDSLAAALDYTRETVAMLDDAYRHARERARAKAAGTTDAQQRNAAFTTELRRIRDEAHLRYASEREVADYVQFVSLYEQTSRSLKSQPLLPRRDGDGTAPPGRATGTVAGATPALGPRPAGVARFLYETNATGGWVDVLADSSVSPGGLAAQNAGSTLASIYYKFGGGFLNSEFAAELTAAGQIQWAGKALAKAYDERYGTGAYAADSAAPTPRQDRLTSLLVPLTPATPPIGDSVYAVIYSVGPQLGAKGIEDEAAYRQIYADAFAAMDDWNQKHPAIENFRVALLSTNAFAGSSAGPKLRAQAAGLVIDATVAALRSRPLLATLTVLVNTDDAAGGDERTAFDTAARTRGITPSRQGFDVPLS